MAKVYIVFADGVEEIEGLTVVDVLRRGGVDTVMVSMTGSQSVNGSHGIVFETDVLFEEQDFSDGDMLVLPGGGAGTQALAAHTGLRELILSYQAEGRYLAAICAAPSVLGMNGVLRGKRATCYPGFEDKLLGADATGEPVVRAGKVITGKGMGVAVDFAIELLRTFDEKKAKEVAAAIQMR